MFYSSKYLAIWTFKIRFSSIGAEIRCSTSTSEMHRVMCYGRFRSTAALAMTMAPSTWHEGCADKFIPDLTSRLEVVNKKTTNQLRNLGAMRFKSEVAGIELTTCHGAKGREWQYVFLINVVEGELPFSFNMGDVKLDEEQRLLYVAVSRASKKLFIVESPVHRFMYTRGRQKYHANLDRESTFVTDYGSQMKAVN